MRESKFQTLVNVPEFKWQTGYHKKSLFIGSCFTENIGRKMVALKYPVDINPFGILYNPVSVGNALRCLCRETKFEKENLISHNGIWHSFLHHGRFSSVNIETALERINQQIDYSSAFLKETGFLFLTFGTAWIYRHKVSNQVVANCHKIPAREFVRERLSIDTIVELYRELLAEIWALNPNLKVVFTVSPIRHWKDGAVENQRSKAALLLAIEELIRNFGNDKCAYFPSYEIVMDELRDYRFYGADMLHLSDVAVNHIWEIFEQVLISDSSKTLSLEVAKIVNAVNHRPIKKDSDEYLKFLKKFLSLTEMLEKKDPNLNLRLEKEIFQKRLNEFK